MARSAWALCFAAMLSRKGLVLDGEEGGCSFLTRRMEFCGEGRRSKGGLARLLYTLVGWPDVSGACAVRGCSTKSRSTCGTEMCVALVMLCEIPRRIRLGLDLLFVSGSGARRRTARARVPKKRAALLLGFSNSVLAGRGNL